MKINEPIGSASYAPLLVRLPMGAYFMVAGWLKLNNLRGFMEEVASMNVLSNNLASLYGTVLPYVEIYVGVALILGLWMTLTSMISSILLATFIYGFGVSYGEHGLFNKDFLLLGASMSLLFSGSGAYSVDNVRRATAS
jgi:uncharacterized membrane protein YphA (DoxX/SURF4 family)